MKQKVVILGASSKPDRYAYKAMKMLQEYGHQTFLVNPQGQEIEGQKVFATLSEISEKVDTLTMYVGPAISAHLADQILALNPRRIIFNPGSENHRLSGVLSKNGIETVEGCTLVMLRTNQFDFAEEENTEEGDTHANSRTSSRSTDRSRSDRY